jgi:XTP/dITP diphosphohydrolase
MMILVLASRNKGKIDELRSELAGLALEISSVLDYPELPEIVEDGKTFEENALIKAKAIAKATGEWALADDSGLEVDALDGRPGIFSARYAGQHGDAKANNAKLLAELVGLAKVDRQARFRCVVALSSPVGECRAVEGTVEGEIAGEARGENGFGYDSLFFYPAARKTFAEMPSEVKNTVSHRGIAVRKARELLVNCLRR